MGIHVRMPADLYETIARAAELAHRPISAEIRFALSNHCDQHPHRDAITAR